VSKPLYLSEYPSFGDFDREALRRLIRRAGRPGARMAEVGSWLGQGSTQVFIEELGPLDGRLTCVDTWEGSPNVARHQELARDFDLFGTFRHNVAHAGDAVIALRMESGAAAATIADGSLDLVFLDGDHSYSATSQDIRAWRRKLAPGGLLCGHDCEARLTWLNRRRMATSRDLDTIPARRGPFAVNHPGVIVAVHESFGRAAHLWAEEPIELADGRRGRSSLWDVRL
jgi:predicted O-methyltransferase YrrM